MSMSKCGYKKEAPDMSSLPQLLLTLSVYCSVKLLPIERLNTYLIMPEKSAYRRPAVICVPTKLPRTRSCVKRET